jgi:ATP-binding cassette subfamily B (MDR/TAP) protein 1
MELLKRILSNSFPKHIILFLYHFFRYSCENATDDEVREAAKQANALRFIENNEFDDLVPGAKNQNFGQGFQRKVGPKGSQMSGGQKQRIAIARAIIKKPRILLLDEATSALDSQSEAVVQESLDKIMQGKTSIAIAHRISTIRDANEILLFDRGVVAERGTYEALVKAEGMFYKLEKGI